MATASLVDYQVLSISSFTIGEDSSIEKTLNFLVPSDMLFDSGRGMPILSFHARPAKDTKLSVLVNNKNIITGVFLRPDNTKALSYPFPTQTPFPTGASNAETVPVQFVVSDGLITIENVILWYQIKRNP